MPNTIRIKRRASGNPGAPASLLSAEIAFNEVDGILYYGKGNTGGVATTIEAIGGKGAFVTVSGTQVVTGNKSFSGTLDLGSAANATTQALGDNSTKLATTAFVKGQNYLTGNQAITLSGDATGTGTTGIIVTLANTGVPAGTYAKVTVDTKGRVTGGATLAATDIPTITASKISDLHETITGKRLDQFAGPTSALSLNAQRITNLADPQDAQDAATKSYVDSIAQGLDPKASVKAATTGNVALSGEQTIDGVALVAGNRVLVKNQTTASQNGIYVVASGSWTRAVEANTWDELVSAYVFVEQGAANADQGYYCSVDAGGTLGATDVTWLQFSGAGQISAGAGLTKDGNTINIGTASSARIVVNADTLDLATTGVGAGTYKSVTVDPYGRVTAGTNPTTLAGFGITDGQAKITASGLLKGDGVGGVAAAVANTDYQVAITASGLLKGNGAGGISAAVAGTDYLTPSSDIDGGTF